MIRINIIIGFVALVLVMGGQAVPDSTEQKTIPTFDISGLRENAKLQVYKILQQITRLELAKVCRYLANSRRVICCSIVTNPLGIWPTPDV